MNARDTLKLAGKFDKESAAVAGQQESKKLNTRRKDYDNMVAQPNFKAPEGTFHRPGSQK